MMQDVIRIKEAATAAITGMFFFILIYFTARCFPAGLIIQSVNISRTMMESKNLLSIFVFTKGFTISSRHMNFIELAKSRYSVRDFSDRQVEPEKMERILEAARVAPTAVNYQPQKLYVVKSPEAVARLAAIRPLFGAPAAVIVCYDSSRSWKNSRDGGHDSGEVDASIVCTHMMLQAWELGIGSCWIGAFSPAAVAGAFGIPDNERPVAILPLGYPADCSQPSERHLSYRADEDMVTIL